MSTTVTIVAIPVRQPDGQHEFTGQLEEPGIVRSVAWCLEKRLVMARGGAQFDEILTLFAEVTPGAPKRNRRFLAMPTGKRIGVPDGYVLDFVGTAASGNTGQVAHVYEVKAVS